MARAKPENIGVAGLCTMTACFVGGRKICLPQNNLRNVGWVTDNRFAVLAWRILLRQRREMTPRIEAERRLRELTR